MDTRDVLLKQIDEICAFKARLEVLDSRYRIGSMAIHRNADGTQSPVFVLLDQGESAGLFYDLESVKAAMTDPTDVAAQLFHSWAGNTGLLQPEDGQQETSV